MVNCFVGMSRSSSAILAYMIMKEKMDAAEAIRKFRKIKDILPSKQYLAILAKFNNEIHGFEGVDVMDDNLDLSAFRKVYRNE